LTFRLKIAFAICIKPNQKKGERVGKCNHQPENLQLLKRSLQNARLLPCPATNSDFSETYKKGAGNLPARPT